jgi:ribosomal protein S27AE
MSKPVDMLECVAVDGWPTASDPCPACGSELVYDHNELRRLECTSCGFRCWDDPDE